MRHAIRTLFLLLILASVLGYAYRVDQATFEKDHCAFAREHGFPAPPECKF